MMKKVFNEKGEFACGIACYAISIVTVVYCVITEIIKKCNK